MKPSLVLIGGLPCSGKTTLAREISKVLNIPSVSKDELEAAVSRKGLCPNKETNGVGYEIMATLANNFRDSGNSIILDFIASKERTISQWPEILDHKIIYIECVCTDLKIHKERINSRNRDINGWYELTWETLLEIKSIYQPFNEEHLVLDSLNNLTINSQRAVTYVTNSSK